MTLVAEARPAAQVTEHQKPFYAADWKTQSTKSLSQSKKAQSNEWAFPL